MVSWILSFFNLKHSYVIFLLWFFSHIFFFLRREVSWRDDLRSEGIMRWRGPWLCVVTEALPWVCSQPSSILKHMHSPQARLGCKAVVEAFPRQQYLPWTLHACLHPFHKADGFFCCPCGLKMKWTFNGMGWGILHAVMNPVQRAGIWYTTAFRRICYSWFHLAWGRVGKEEVSKWSCSLMVRN